MTESNYANYMIQKYSLAVAIAVMKNKPENVSLLEYINSLRENVEKQQENLFEEVTVSEKDFNISDDINDNINDCDCDNIDENLLNDSHESVTILKDVNLRQNGQERTAHDPIGEIIDIFKSIEQNDVIQIKQPKLTTSTPNNLTQSTFYESLQSVKDTSNITGNNDITFCASLSQDNTNTNDSISQRENNIDTISKLKAPAIITNIFDSQETEIYTVHGFTENYTHVSQSQDNIVVAKKLLHQSDNSIYNVLENDSNGNKSRNRSLITDVDLASIRDLHSSVHDLSKVSIENNEIKSVDYDLINQNTVYNQKDDICRHDLKRVKINTNISLDWQELSFNGNNEESENMFSNHSRVKFLNAKHNSTESSNEFSFIYKEFDDSSEKGIDSARARLNEENLNKRNNSSGADTNYNILDQSNIQCSQNNLNLTLNNTENLNIFETEYQDFLLSQQRNEHRQLMNMEFENNGTFYNNQIDTNAKCLQWDQNTTMKYVNNPTIHKDGCIQNCGITDHVITNNTNLHKHNSLQWNQDSDDIQNVTTNFNNPTFCRNNSFQRNQKSDDIQNVSSNIIKNTFYKCKSLPKIKNSAEIQNTTSYYIDNPKCLNINTQLIQNSTKIQNLTTDLTNNSKIYKNLILKQNQNVSENLNTTNINNTRNHADIINSQQNQNSVVSSNVRANNPIIHKNTSLECNQNSTEIHCINYQNIELKGDTKNINLSKNNDDNNLNNSNINDEKDDDATSDDFTESQTEIITFKVIEEFNRVKNYLIKPDRRSSGDFLTSGYRSNSQTMKSLTSQSTEHWLNESGHCLLNYIIQCPLIPRTLKITEEISRNLGQFIDKLHEDEQYPSFLEKLLEADQILLQGIYEESRDEEDVLKKDENIYRLLLLNRSINVIRYTLEKIIAILEEIHANVKKDELIELMRLEQSENMCYIFHILEILIKRYINISKVISSQSTQPSQDDQKTLKRSDITEIWRRKWNLSKSDVSEGSFKKKCVLTQCCQVLNKIIVDAMDGYSLVSFAALQCFNLLQSK